MGRFNYYAVRRGYRVGIYTSWEECAPLVLTFPNAAYKGFNVLENAEKFLRGEPVDEGSPVSVVRQRGNFQGAGPSFSGASAAMPSTTYPRSPPRHLTFGLGDASSKHSLIAIIRAPEMSIQCRRVIFQQQRRTGETVPFRRGSLC